MHQSLFRHFGSAGRLTHDVSGVVTDVTVVVKRAVEYEDEYDNLPYNMLIVEFQASNYPEATRTKDVLVVTEGDDAGTYKIGKEVFNNGFVIGREVTQ